MWRNPLIQIGVVVGLAEISPPSPLSRFILRMTDDIAFTKLAMILTFFVLAAAISYGLILHWAYS